MASTRILAGAAALAILLAGCERGPTDPLEPSVGGPHALAAEYEWVLERWDGTQPVGHPTVQFTWSVPDNWRGEPFRVYGRRSTDADYLLIATVTSCADGFCRYSDINVVGGRSYDYYAATVDERTGLEVASASAVRVAVPVFTAPQRPVPQEARSYSNALLVRWQPGGPTANLWKYRIFLVAIDGQPTEYLYQVGETDGQAFLDLRAENGHSYTYRIAALDVEGHPSAMSAPVTGTPRADAPSFSISVSGLDPASISVFGPAEPIRALGPAPGRGRLEVGADGKYTRFSSP